MPFESKHFEQSDWLFRADTDAYGVIWEFRDSQNPDDYFSGRIVEDEEYTFATLVHVFISEGRRGSGIASEGLRKTEESLKELGVQKVFVVFSLDKTIQFLRRQGYTVIGPDSLPSSMFDSFHLKAEQLDHSIVDEEGFLLARASQGTISPEFKYSKYVVLEKNLFKM